MNRKFIYLINPISGTKNKEGLIKLISKRTSNDNIPYEIIQTNAEADYRFLTDKSESENITDIIVCGGDGTVNQVAAAVRHLNVNIGIIPIGSGNGLALSAGIPRDAGKAIDIIMEGKAAKIDAFLINGNFSCMLCGLGFDAQVAHDFSKQHKRGLVTYTKQTIKNFFSATPYPFVVRINEMIITTDAFFVSIANSNQFGNNVTIAPQASICDGLIDIVIVNKMSKMKLLYSIIKQILSGTVNRSQQKNYRPEDIFYYQTKKLTIENPKFAPLHIDGDPADTAADFNISVVEKAFSLIQA